MSSLTSDGLPKKIDARKIKQGDDYYSASMISYYNKDGVGIWCQ